MEKNKPKAKHLKMCLRSASAAETNKRSTPGEEVLENPWQNDFLCNDSKRLNLCWAVSVACIDALTQPLKQAEGCTFWLDGVFQLTKTRSCANSDCFVHEHKTFVVGHGGMIQSLAPAAFVSMQCGANGKRSGFTAARHSGYLCVRGTSRTRIKIPCALI